MGLKKRELEALGEHFTDIHTELSNIKSYSKELEKRCSELKEENDALYKLLNELHNKVVNLEKQVSTNSTAISTQEKIISDLVEVNKEAVDFKTAFNDYMAMPNFEE